METLRYQHLHIDLTNGETIQASPEIIVPSNWNEALNLVSEKSEELGIPYVIIGSLGISVVCQKPWGPIKPTGEIRDLDVYVLGNKEERSMFHDAVQSSLAPEMPVIDSDMRFGSHILFNEGCVSIIYKDFKRNIDPTVFQTYDRYAGEITIPVLHPITIHKMLSVYKRSFSPKIQSSYDKLGQFIKSGHPGFPYLQPELLSPLDDFRKRLVIEHRLRYLREQIVKMKGNPRVAALIDSTQEILPGLWDRLHDLAEKENV